MKEILYHGSREIVDKPTYGKGKRDNDYGLGFYCTKQQDMANEWAVDENNDGYCNQYELEQDGLKVLDLTDNKYCFLHWLAILLENREFSLSFPLAVEAKEYILSNFKVPYKRYDVIIGYRADDSYFTFAKDFLAGTISYRQLCNAMVLGKLGLQYVLISEKAFEHIKFIRADVALRSDWLAKKIDRDKAARREYFDAERNKRQKNDLYITKILDEEIKNDDPRLR